jgi:hypothetical protein
MYATSSSAPSAVHYNGLEPHAMPDRTHLSAFVSSLSSARAAQTSAFLLPHSSSTRPRAALNVGREPPCPPLQLELLPPFSRRCRSAMAASPRSVSSEPRRRAAASLLHRAPLAASLPLLLPQVRELTRRQSDAGAPPEFAPFPSRKPRRVSSSAARRSPERRRS